MRRIGRLSVFFATAVIAHSQLGMVDPLTLQPYARLAEPEVKKAEGLWSIAVKSDQLFYLPYVPDPVHNYIIISAPDEEEIYCLHGLSIDRTTHKLVSAGTNEEALLVYGSDATDRITADDTCAMADVYCGSFEEVMRKFMIALDAAHTINRQNLAYDLLEIWSPAQNSNSVAYTLVNAMGCDFPRGNVAVWKPGHGRNLLPEGWRSHYEDWTPPSNNPNFLIWYAQQMEYALQNQRNQMLISGEKPEAGRALFFDTATPFAAYEPLVISDPLTAYAAYEQERAKTATEAVAALNILPF